MAMKNFHQLVSGFVICCLALPPALSQENLGTSFGIPNSSPGVLWPRGMSIESLSPSNLYPNGSRFGLSNTSGGFGMSGSGPISGVGLTERAVSSLVQEELAHPYAYIRQLSVAGNAEAMRSVSLFNTALGGQFRTEMPRQSALYPSIYSAQGLINPYALPSVETVLHDSSASTDAILRTGL